MAANSRVTVTLLSIMALLLVSLLASPLISSAESRDATENQYDNRDNPPACPGAEKAASVGPTTQNKGEQFETTGDRFRVSYRFNFEASESNETDPEFRVNIKQGSDSVASQTRRSSGSYSFLVTEPAGSYKVKTTVTPERGASYTLTVEDCTGEGKQQPPKHSSTTPEHPKPSAPASEKTEHPKTTEHPEQKGSIPEEPGYDENVDDDIARDVDESDILDEVDSDIPASVDKGTIPNEELPNTGGPPVLDLLLLGGAGVATVVALLNLTARLRRR